MDNFASDSGIYAMIINMQAFNSSKNQKIIDKKLDSFRSRRPIDIIAQTNPILIIDEPQSVEGKQTKESLKSSTLCSRCAIPPPTKKNMIWFTAWTLWMPTTSILSKRSRRWASR